MVFVLVWLIYGVCPAWAVRLVVVALFIFTGSLAFWGYILAWFVLPAYPNRWEYSETCERETFESDNEPVYRKHASFRYSDTSTAHLCNIRKRLDEMVERAERIECYMTSQYYDSDRDVSR